MAVNVVVTPDWQRVTDLTEGAVPTGAACVIQNQGNTRLMVMVSPTMPPDHNHCIVVPALPEFPLYIGGGNPDVWVSSRSALPALANIQVLE